MSAPQMMDFTVPSFVKVGLARDTFDLHEIKTGEKAGSLGSNQVEQLEKGYVGATRRLVVYEAGAFDGEPYNLPPDAPSWQDVRFGFTSSLVVLAERK